MAAELSDHFVAAFHNQLPELYCNNSVDAGSDRYPAEQVDRCPEGAGGGNVRMYGCTPDGKVLDQIQGYWRSEIFQEEIRHFLRLWEAHRKSENVRSIRESHLGEHRRRRGEGRRPPEIAVQNVLLRGHEEADRDFLKPIAEVLRRIEDEVYTKGKIG